MNNYTVVVFAVVDYDEGIVRTIDVTMAGFEPETLYVRLEPENTRHWEK